VTLSPASATLQTKQTQQFTATVSGTSTTGVNWQVNGAAGGNTSVGTIDSNGLYTAPAVVPTPNAVSVSAVAQADTTKIASATITITNSGLPVVVTPAAVNVAAGAQQTFVATVGSSTITPGWAAHCSSLVAGGCGSITSGGVYTAPLSPPPGGTVSVVAVTPDNTALVGTASVTVQFGAGSLRGGYAFKLAGSRGTQAFNEIGTLTFDGSGHVTVGSRDAFFGGAAVHTDIGSGTYQIGPDGRGSVSAGGMVWQVSLVGFGHGMALEIDSDGTAATGTFDAQSPGEFQLGSLSGNYTLLASGFERTSFAPFAMAGGISLDGAGNVSGGTLDVNSSASLAGASVTGTISAPSSSGVGSISLTTSSGPYSFTYYMIDASRMNVVSNDVHGQTIGELVRQGSAISTSSLRNAYAFTATGPVAQGSFAAGGALALDGAGAITGISDNLGNGQVNAAATGSYTVANAGSGRVTATVTLGTATMHWVMYPRLDGALDFIRIDAGAPIHGTALVQTAAPFDPSLEKGPFSALLTASSTSTAQAEDVLGQFPLTGGSSFNATLALDDAGTLQPNVSILAGGYLVARDTGRGTAAISSSSARLNGTTLYVYQVDSRTALMMIGGSAQPMVGIMQQQF
jgi:hypothetical protein